MLGGSSAMSKPCTAAEAGSPDPAKTLPWPAIEAQSQGRLGVAVREAAIAQVAAAVFKGWAG